MLMEGNWAYMWLAKRGKKEEEIKRQIRVLVYFGSNRVAGS